MPIDAKKALSNTRFSHAEECLSAAKNLLEFGSYKSAANRAYYAIFHAMRAVLAIDEIDMKHHSGIISEFRKRYIKTGIFEEKLSDIISLLFDARTDSDYDDFYVILEEEADRQVEEADYFLQCIQRYLQGIDG